MKGVSNEKKAFKLGKSILAPRFNPGLIFRSTANRPFVKSDIRGYQLLDDVARPSWGSVGGTSALHSALSPAQRALHATSSLCSKDVRLGPPGSSLRPCRCLGAAGSRPVARRLIERSASESEGRRLVAGAGQSSLRF